MEVYDPILHMTAGELRFCGVPIPVDIPDRAWILRSDYTGAMLEALSDSEAYTIDQDSRALMISAPIQLPPFQWVEVTTVQGVI